MNALAHRGLLCSAALLAACARDPQVQAPRAAPAPLQATYIEPSRPSEPRSEVSKLLVTELEPLLESATPSIMAPMPAVAVTFPASVAAMGESPDQVIARANTRAMQTPTEAGYDSAVMSYTFVEGGLYKVFSAPGNVTDLVLQPGERIVGQPAAGDTVRWRLGVGEGMADGLPQAHVLIKPSQAGLTTNLTLHTSRRSYFVRLESLEETAMVAVRWDYPHDEQSAPFYPEPSAARGSGESIAPEAVDVSDLHLDYVVEVTEGKPSWVPQTVYDDGRRTYIRFGREVLYRESPVLHVIERGEQQLVNYAVRDNLYIVDRVFSAAELRLGQNHPDVVRITRN